MNALLLYMLKSALYLSAFYLIYYLLLSRDTSYSRNRIFILLSLATALILPAFALQSIKPLNFHLFGKFLAGVFITASSETAEKSDGGFPEISLLHFVYLAYITGMAIFILKLLADLINLFFLILRQKNNETRIIRYHGFSSAGFSAMGYVFINTRLDDQEAAEIIRHEENHIKRNHFVDIIFIETVKAFQWFNPAIYLFNRSLRAIHEFQADQECLTSGIPIVNYQSLLLNQVFKTNSFTLSNSFSNPSLIRKRMIMMTKERTSSLASMKLLFVIPVIGLMFIFISGFGEINSSNAPAPASEVTAPETENTKDVPFVEVEQMPMFPGGDQALLQFIAKNTGYPENAKKNNIQGKVIVRFCITATGKVNKVSVLKGVDPELDNEAVRVVNTLPQFIPGKQGGKDVPVWYMVPITFALQ